MDNIKIGSKSEENVTCAHCKKSVPLAGSHLLKGKDNKEIYLCADCKTLINKGLEQETKNPNILMAVILGVLGGVLSGFIWYYIAILTKLEIGYVAIAVGFIVGKAVCLGAGKKRGKQLQVISLFIALVSLIAAKYFIFLHFVKKAVAEELGEIAAEIGLISISPFDPEFLKSLVSPFGLIILAIAFYIAFAIPKPRKI